MVAEDYDPFLEEIEDYTHLLGNKLLATFIKCTPMEKHEIEKIKAMVEGETVKARLRGDYKGSLVVDGNIMLEMYKIMKRKGYLNHSVCRELYTRLERFYREFPNIIKSKHGR